MYVTEQSVYQNCFSVSCNFTGRRKIHFTLTDGTELCEEYDVKNNNLLLRKWRKRSQMGATRPWEIEVGEPDLSANMAGLSLGTQHLTENTSNVKFWLQ